MLVKGETVAEEGNASRDTGLVSATDKAAPAVAPPLRAIRRQLRNDLNLAGAPRPLVEQSKKGQQVNRKPKKVKVHSLTGRIDDRMMLAAFKSVKQNRGAAGIDKQSIVMFEANLDQNLLALMRDLKSGEFYPRPLRRVYIPKADGNILRLVERFLRSGVIEDGVRKPT